MRVGQVPDPTRDPGLITLSWRCVSFFLSFVLCMYVVITVMLAWAQVVEEEKEWVRLDGWTDEVGSWISDLGWVVYRYVSVK